MTLRECHFFVRFQYLLSKFTIFGTIVPHSRTLPLPSFRPGKRDDKCSLGGGDDDDDPFASTHPELLHKPPSDSCRATPCPLRVSIDKR